MAKYRVINSFVTVEDYLFDEIIEADTPEHAQEKAIDIVNNDISPYATGQMVVTNGDFTIISQPETEALAFSVLDAFDTFQEGYISRDELVQMIRQHCNDALAS